MKPYYPSNQPQQIPSNYGQPYNMNRPQSMSQNYPNQGNLLTSSLPKFIEPLPQHEELYLQNKARPLTVALPESRLDQLKKQEEYKRMLDFQMQADNKRKEKEKELLINAKKKDANVESYNEKEEKQNLKEKERIKQMEYNKYLQQQIEEKRKKKELEKQKQLEEDMKYEEKLKQQQMENAANYKNYRSGNQGNNPNLNGTDPNKAMFFNKKDPNAESPDNYFNPTGNYNQPMNNNFQGNPQQLNDDYNPSQIPQNIQEPMMETNYMQGKSIPRTPVQYQTDYRQNINSPNQNNLTNSYGLNSLPRTAGPYGFNSKLPSTPSSNSAYTTHYMGETGGLSRATTYDPNKEQGIINEELLRNFVNRQMEIIHEYETKVENFQVNSGDIISVVKLLISEKNLALEKMKNERENIKSCIGFYPMQSEFNNKISKLLDMILENKIDKIQRMANNNQTGYSMGNNLYNSNTYNTNIKNDMGLSTQSKKNRPNTSNRPKISHYSIESRNSLEATNKISPENIDLNGLNYRSKYEDLKKSIVMAEDINPEFKNSMAGFSKFVTPVANKEQNNSSFNLNLYETWKDTNYNVDTKNSKSKILESSASHTLPGNSKVVYQGGVSVLNNNVISQDETTLNNNQIDLNKSNKSIGDFSKIQSKVDTSLNHIDNNLLESAKHVRISKEEKDKTLILREETERDHNKLESSFKAEKTLPKKENNPNKSSINNLSMSMKKSKNNLKESKNIKEIKDSTINNLAKNINDFMKEEVSQEEMGFTIHNYSDEEKEKDNDEYNDFEEKDSLEEEGKGIKEEENEGYDEGEFTTDEKGLEKLEKTAEMANKDLDLGDYQDIHESQKIQSQMNFFEDSCIDTVNTGAYKTTQNRQIRPNSPKAKKVKEEVKEKKNKKKKEDILRTSSDGSINLGEDSYGDNIINDLDKYRKIALEESSVSISKRK